MLLDCRRISTASLAPLALYPILTALKLEDPSLGKEMGLRNGDCELLVLKDAVHIRVEANAKNVHNRSIR